ncbi:GNAT family N-acetyltransferase [Streptomyces sp. NPDC014676]|uniref:GNAT family N-acetyltransferase n=1 Tax=Streptomyces sp. NPDC014676 TaxID=3364879 RepID=UPI0036F5F2D8
MRLTVTPERRGILQRVRCPRIPGKPLTPRSAEKMTMPLHTPVRPLRLRRENHSIALPDGIEILTERATVDDFLSVNSLHHRTSLDSLYSRYQSARRELTEADWRHFTEAHRGLTWVTRPATDASTVIAVTQVMFAEDQGTGELSILVDDTWQSRGLGTELARHALSQARLLGLRAVTVMTGRDNNRMIRICRFFGGRVTGENSHVVDFSLPVD